MPWHSQCSRCLQVDFEAVPDLVAGRKVFLRDGQAYVSKTDIVSLVVGHFRCFLNFLAAMLKDNANVHEDCFYSSNSQ